ncbi:MAG: hypothetical protein AAB315_04565, partial [Pseudomonadota bacterium]
FFGASRKPLQGKQYTVSRSAAASENANATGGNGHSAMGAVAAMDSIPMGASAAVSEILRLGIRRLASTEVHRERAGSTSLLGVGCRG